MRHKAVLFFVFLFFVGMSIPAQAAFSLTHQTGAYDELQDNGMQKVHTDYQILYAKPGETVYLYRPERAAMVGYVRWYCYDTDRAVPGWYSAEDTPKTDKNGNPVPRIESIYPKDTTDTSNPKFRYRNDYGWFAFGYTTDRVTTLDRSYIECKYTMHKGDTIYRIACDEGIWNDFTWNNSGATTEPHLSKRIIYEIRPAKWMADSLELCKVSPENPTNDKYLEEHEMIAPTGRQLYIGPDMMYRGSGKQIKLQHYYYYCRSNYHYYNSQGKVTAPSNDANWKWYVNGVEDPSITLTDKAAQYAPVSCSTPGTVVYTLKYNSANGYYFNVARFRVTYMDVDVVGPSTTIPAPTKKMERIYEERFNYERPGTTNFAFWLGHFDIDESTYGYYDKNLDGDPSYRHVRKGNITWSEYAVTNKKAIWVPSGETVPYVYQHVDSAENVSANAKEGYMLYCDGSQQPGQVFNLKVNANLCPGSTMYFSAYLCDASSTGDANKSAPNMDFIVTGIDGEGKEHTLTTFTTGEFGINAVNKVGETAKMERGKWYQIMFPVKFGAKISYTSYRLRITNKSTSSDGNDFAIDDIRIYVQKPPVMPIQASTSDCIDKAMDSIRAYLRIDYQEIDYNGEDPLYYQWREGDNVLHYRYYNQDSLDAELPANTFGCIRILSTDEAIAASGLTSANLLAFDSEFRETKNPVYRYIWERIDATTERYVLYVAQAIEVSVNNNYTGFVATDPDALGDRTQCGTYADMIIAGGTRITIDDHITLGDSVISTCGHRTYTLNIVLTQIIQDETEGDLKTDTTHCKADWLMGDSTYVNAHKEEYGGKSFDEIAYALDVFRTSPSSVREFIESLITNGKLILDTASITMYPSEWQSYTAFPLPGSAGSKRVCASPRFLHIQPSNEVENMMVVGNSTEVLPRSVTNKPRVVRISEEQKRQGSFTLPLYLKGDEDEAYVIERVVLEGTTYPAWSDVLPQFELTVDEGHTGRALGQSETLELSGVQSLEAGYDYTFHIVFVDEDAPHIGCERGHTYFTLRIVPDVVTWFGGNWNVDFNWSPFIPLPETDVVLLPRNYNVTFSSDSIYDFGYVRNQCRNMYMPAYMSMAGQEHIQIHGQVYIDIPLNTHHWTLTSIPLQGIVSGDLYAPQSEESNYFAVAPINQTVASSANDRHTYEIYYSQYDAVHDKWHKATNTLVHETHPLEAYMIGVEADSNAPDTVVIRLPKPVTNDTYHYYHMDTGEWLPEYETIVRDANYGKPAWNGESTIALKEVYGDVYLLGNPTFGCINITKLVADNEDKLTGRYYMPEAVYAEPTHPEMSTQFTHDVHTDSVDILLPPCRGILLEGKMESAELIITISDRDITEPGFAPNRASAPSRIKKHELEFNDGGGIPIGAVRSTAMTINETSPTIAEELEPREEGIIEQLNLYRTLLRNGCYNTLCLPFDLSAAEIATSPLAGIQLYTFDHADKVGEAQLDIYVNEASAIQAGIPYLVKWAPTEPEQIPQPLVFHDVHIKDIWGKTIGEAEEIQFVGNVPTAAMTNGDHNQLFVGANNTLFWPNTSNGLKGFRAYFQVPASGPAAVPKYTPARLVIGQNVVTDVESTQQAAVNVQKVIRDGIVYILRDGKWYNVLGMEVEK